MYSTFAFGKNSKESGFEKIAIERNVCGDGDVVIQLKYCGVCHSDVHVADNDTGRTKYPCIPGHELAGVVSKVGRAVTKVKVGDLAGVGCMVDSCGDCRECRKGQEQFCMKGGCVQTYNGDVRPEITSVRTDKGWTFGGYSGQITVPQGFVIKVPSGYPLASAGPVFCAGITMFSPLTKFGARKGGLNVGIIGIGGLGQMGVQLAKAMGNTVTAVSTSPNKEAAARDIGADHFVVSTDQESMKGAARSLDLIINTVSAAHDVNTYLPLLAANGTIVQLGLTFKPHSIQQYSLMFSNLSLAGSAIGGIRETQECIDFCHQHDIVPKTKLITSKELDKVYEELRGKNDSVLRNVLDIEASK